MIEKASIYTMNALNKSSELCHTSVNRKAKPVVEGEHDKSWNDHDHSLLQYVPNFEKCAQSRGELSLFVQYKIFTFELVQRCNFKNCETKFLSVSLI